MENDDQFSERELHRLVRKIDGFCFGNGKPPLEDRIMHRVDGLIQHTKNGYRQGDVDIWAELKSERESRQRQHAQNMTFLISILGLCFTVIGLLIAVLKTGR